MVETVTRHRLHHGAVAAQQPPDTADPPVAERDPLGRSKAVHTLDVAQGWFETATRLRLPVGKDEIHHGGIGGRPCAGTTRWWRRVAVGHAGTITVATSALNHRTRRLSVS